MFESTLRYAAAFDKDPVVNMHSKYDSLIVRSHLLAYASGSVPARLQTLANDHGVEFYIEPMAWDFRAGTNFRKSNGNLKGWHATYADALGDPFVSILNSRGNVNASRINDAEIKRISEDIVRFQEEHLAASLEDKVGKYEEIDATELRPKAIIPWIHKLTVAEDVIPFRKILEYSNKATDLPTKPCIFATKRFIRDVTNRTTVIEIVEDLGIDEVFVWIDDLDKRNTNERNYKNLIDFIHELHTSSINSHMFYGDYFSNLLAFFGLGGITYGTNFGEENQERLEDAGGGQIERYYVNESRDFLQTPAAVEIQQEVGASVCTCEGCEDAISDWTDLTMIQQSDESLLPILQNHFLCMKESHAQEISNNSLDDLLDALESNCESYSDPYSRSVIISPSKQVDHLLVWKDVIEQEKSKAVQDLSAISSRLK